ncbi:MAG: hypothetical protein KC466_15155 [Myxococcales bacterium]|nr:hypothetical protein [Myxococcales bacterium]
MRSQRYWILGLILLASAGCGGADEKELPVVEVGAARERVLDEIAARVATLGQELAVARRDVENLQGDVTRLRATLDGKVAQVDALQARIDRLRGTPALVPGIPRLGLQRVQRASGFVFEFLGCSRAGDRVFCRMQVTAKDQDRRLRITAREIGRYGWTRFFDDLNTPYDPVWMRLGEQTTEAPAIGATLKADTPTPLEFRFEGLLKRATAGSRLVLGCSTDQEPFSIEFETIPFE